MTEAEWLACLDPEKLLLYIRDKVSDRKMRLFALACCRRIWDCITDPRCRAAAEFADRFVEVGVARRRGRPAVAKAAAQACRDADMAQYQSRDQPAHIDRVIDANAFHAALATIEGSAWFAAHLASGFSANAVGMKWLRDNQTGPAVWDPASREVEYRHQIPLFRDIFGNPFRPATFDPSWRTSSVSSLASSAYEHLLPQAHIDPARLSILADALEEAGCTERAILDHLRSPGPHCRGCWPVDLILAKE